MTNKEYIRVTAQLAVLRDVMADGYQGKTIDNIVQQLESVRNEYVKKMSHEWREEDRVRPDNPADSQYNGLLHL